MVVEVGILEIGRERERGEELVTGEEERPTLDLRGLIVGATATGSCPGGDDDGGLCSDLTRNYLNGTIPAEWSSLPLQHISLLGNRLRGADTQRVREHHQSYRSNGRVQSAFGSYSSGAWQSLPIQISNYAFFTHIATCLHLSSNYFTGELPERLAQLITLKRLVIEASGLNGPIPPGIALLEKMDHLRISDLNGNEDTFPQLILRSCNITGEGFYGTERNWRSVGTFDLMEAAAGVAAVRGVSLPVPSSQPSRKEWHAVSEHSVRNVGNESAFVVVLVVPQSLNLRYFDSYGIIRDIMQNHLFQMQKISEMRRSKFCVQ
ncbi:hypothetical protein F0562_010541 [Nyssa sinensis]|uniref:Uncharacterized protein n=1 Tax=Nyssa sinensis TaxID=561372 RepID=A0A5J5A210_9ASTE|nr:hypothetical protein F0562_010541 [Nyssa sinensis]